MSFEHIEIVVALTGILVWQKSPTYHSRRDLDDIGRPTKALETYTVNSCLQVGTYDSFFSDPTPHSALQHLATATACNGGIESTELCSAWIAATCCRNCRDLQRSLS